MMKPILLLAAGAVLAAPGLAHAAAVTPERIMRAQEHLTYSGTLLINGKQRVQIDHGASTQQRQAFLGPKGEVVDLLVADGQIRWHYTPKTQRVRVLPLEMHIGLKQRLELLERNYRFQVLGQARRANRPVVLTRFLPRHPGNLVHLLWVDHDTGLPLAVERREPDGQLIDRSEYQSIRFGAPQKPELFRFQLPQGVAVESAMTLLARGGAQDPLPRGLEFNPGAIKALPAGYALLNWQYFRSGRHVPTLNWRFHDGLNSLSLFAVEKRHQAPLPPEARTVVLNGGPGYVLTHGAERMLIWKSGNAAFTLVGHLPEADMIKAAESTR